MSLCTFKKCSEFMLLTRQSRLSLALRTKPLDADAERYGISGRLGAEVLSCA